MNKKLVAYFSASGVTKGVAKKISKIVNGDLYEIVPEIPYTDEDLNWTNKNSRSSIEMNDLSFRPKFVKTLDNINEYDVIYLGFPIWWGIAPTIVNTFLESYDFSNKTIIPFATSGSSDIGSSAEKLKPSVSSSTKVLIGKRLSNYISEEEITEWINSLNN